MMPPIYIFDLDGTLTDSTHRHRFLAQTPKDWDSFNAACVNDTVNEPIANLARRLWYGNAEVWIWTGRCVSTREMTNKWLIRHGIRVHKMLMRGIDDHREDTVLKKEWLDATPAHERARIVAVFEDRTRMVRMYRDAGLTCLQVKDGDF